MGNLLGPALANVFLCHIEGLIFSTCLFQTSVFRKPSFTGLGLSFFSFCPYIFKINPLKTLLHRAYHLSSNYSLFNDEICNLKTFFEGNGYPLKVFESILRKFLNKVRRPIMTTITVEKRTVYICVTPIFRPAYSRSNGGFRRRDTLQIHPHFLSLMGDGQANAFRWRDTSPRAAHRPIQSEFYRPPTSTHLHISTSMQQLELVNVF